MRFVAIFVFSFALAVAASAQELSPKEVFDQLRTKDSELFDEGFNKCDISRFETLIGEKFVFLHDVAGETNSKSAFVDQVRNGVCAPNYKTRRELVAGSLEVFPLRRDGKLYAAIQNGRHRFYEFPNGKKTLRSTARFTHVWELTEAGWKLVYALSFDHRAVAAKAKK